MQYQDDFQIGGVKPVKLADPAATKAEKMLEVMQIVAGVVTMNPHAAKPLRDLRKDFEVCRHITRAFRENLDKAAPVRELAVLKAIYPARLDEIQDGDLFAGRFSDGIIGHTTEIWGGYVGFYLLDSELQHIIDSKLLSATELEEAQAMREFWRTYATHNIGYREAYRQLVSKQDAIGDADWIDLPNH